VSDTPKRCAGCQHSGMASYTGVQLEVDGIRTLTARSPAFHKLEHTWIYAILSLAIGTGSLSGSFRPMLPCTHRLFCKGPLLEDVNFER